MYLIGSRHLLGHIGQKVVTESSYPPRIVGFQRIQLGHLLVVQSIGLKIPPVLLQSIL